MNFSFVILTEKQSIDQRIIDSIEAEEIANSEIVLVGRQNETYCQQKNRATDLAKYENVVYMHDYIVLEAGWYKGFLEFGNNWDVCMTRILNKNGDRFRDWTTWDDEDYGAAGIIVEPWCPNGQAVIGGPYLVPYDYNKTDKMYVSGSYLVAKKEFMKKYQFLNTLNWGQGEDVEWSIRARRTWNYKMNILSAVRFLKQK